MVKTCFCTFPYFIPYWTLVKLIYNTFVNTLLMRYQTLQKYALKICGIRIKTIFIHYTQCTEWSHLPNPDLLRFSNASKITFEILHWSFYYVRKLICLFILVQTLYVGGGGFSDNLLQYDRTSTRTFSVDSQFQFLRFTYINSIFHLSSFRTLGQLSWLYSTLYSYLLIFLIILVFFIISLLSLKSRNHA